MIALWTLLACGPQPVDQVPWVYTSPELAALDTAGDTATGEPLADDGPLPLCINELLTDNKAALIADDGSTPDWIELHNPGDTAVSLDGWTVTDDPDDPGKHPLDPGLSVGPHGFLVLYADDEDLGPHHLSFKLSASDGAAGLFHPDGRGEVVGYGQVEADFSVYRLRNCCPTAACLSFDYRGTPGASNE